MGKLQISLKAARVNKNLKQSDVARILLVNIATILSWEKGLTSPKAPQLYDLCAIYEVDADNIFLLRESI